MTEKNNGIPLFDRKRSCLKRITGCNTGEGNKLGTLLLSNDENNVTADKVLSYF